MATTWSYAPSGSPRCASTTTRGLIREGSPRGLRFRPPTGRCPARSAGRSSPRTAATGRPSASTEPGCQSLFEFVEPQPTLSVVDRGFPVDGRSLAPSEWNPSVARNRDRSLRARTPPDVVLRTEHDALAAVIAKVPFEVTERGIGRSIAVTTRPVPMRAMELHVIFEPESRVGCARPWKSCPV